LPGSNSPWWPSVNPKYSTILKGQYLNHTY
jgi:hypothetical protein